MKTVVRPVQGFQSIYYKGQPVTFGSVTSTEKVIVARNRLHRWYLQKRYRKLKLRVVVEKQLDFRNLDFKGMKKVKED